MSLEAELSAALDGVPIGRGSLKVVCDLPHEIRKPVDTEDSVQYECIRVDDSVTIFGRFGYDPYDIWTPDLLRCPDCEIESLSEPTDGYEEALVTLDIRWDGDHHVLDARDLDIIDHSPVDHGRDPPNVPLAAIKPMLQRGDPGALRRSRMERSIDRYREKGNDELADLLESQLRT